MNRCPLCGHDKNKSLLIADKKFVIGACERCSLVFTVTDNNIASKSLYDEGDYRLVSKQGIVFEGIVHFEQMRIIRAIGENQPQKGKLLDFGCGKGFFLRLAQKNGWTVKGIETSHPRASYGKAVYGVDISMQAYNGGVIPGGPFDVITFFHVLEHLPEPKLLLRELLEKNLRVGGMVVIEVPNIDSWQAKIAGGQWMQIDAVRHRSHFGSETLGGLISELKLTILKRGFFSLRLGVLGMINSLMSRFGYQENAFFELKNKRTMRLVLSILLLLPLGFLLEVVACCFRKGGVLRIYARKPTST